MGSGEKIGKILVSFLILLLIAQFTEVATASDGNTNSYSVNGISFDYPSSWIISYEERNSSNTISASKSEFSFLSMSPFQVQITHGILEEGMENQMNTTIYPIGWTKVSNQNITIDGQDAILQVFDVYSIWPPMWGYKVEIITFSKNNNTYELLFEAPKEEYDNENFQVIKDSFKVE